MLSMSFSDTPFLFFFLVLQDLSPRGPPHTAPTHLPNRESQASQRPETKTHGLCARLEVITAFL